MIQKLFQSYDFSSAVDEADVRPFGSKRTVKIRTALRDLKMRNYRTERKKSIFDLFDLYLEILIFLKIEVN